MIKIAVDEAYAFDMLSILEVKLEESYNTQNLRNFQEFAERIEDQIGVLLEEILASDEYNILLKSNMEIFNAVNMAKKDIIKASQVDNLNYERWKAKNRLQERFF